MQRKDEHSKLKIEQNHSDATTTQKVDKLIDV